MGNRLAVLGTVATVAWIGGMHCGGPAKAGGEGAECYRAEECAAGLVCIAEKCTSDLSSISIVTDAARPPMLPEAASPTTD
jgi:hypothetical protein